MTREPEVKFDYAYLHEDVDRHGNVRIYFRRGPGWPKWRMHDPVGSPAFVARHAELLDMDRETQWAVRQGRTPSRIAHGSLQALCNAYQASAVFARLDAKTRKQRASLLRQACERAIAEDSAIVFGAMPAARLTTKTVRILRDWKDREGHPVAGNNLVKALRSAFSWAIEDQWGGIEANPAREVKMIRTAGGFHSWTDDEVSRFEKTHPRGTKARLALDILLLTGVRRSDLVRLGDQFITAAPDAADGRRWLRFTAAKNAGRKPVLITIPILPELEEALHAGPRGEMVWLTTEHGRPFTVAGFGNWFKKQCVRAGLSHCTAHGVRKAGSTRAANNRATAHELMSMYGWETIEQAEVYTRAADRVRLAGSGMARITSAEAR